MAAFGSLKQAIFDKEARKQQYQSYVRGLNAYDRHKKFISDYAGFYGKETSPQQKMPIKTDQDTLREGYRFIRTEEDDINPSWEQRLVKRYYDKLFKEYCLADMSRYKTGKIGLRWRTEKEVIAGKVPQVSNIINYPAPSSRVKHRFVCGNKHCNEKDGLASYEVNFSYDEAGESKQALVKLVTCERCTEKLFYKNRKEKAQSKQKDKEEQEQTQSKQRDKHHRRKRERSGSDDDSGKEYDGRKDRRKGRNDSSSRKDDQTSDEEDFDEYLQGMFP